MPEQLMKITYHNAGGATKKLNAYLRMPSKVFSILRREIEIYLFKERQLTQSEFRTFWIDADLDEIDIVNQDDYDIFMAKSGENMHMQIAALTDVKKEEGPAAPQAEDDPTNFIIHDLVECDSCGVSPIIGFRYKCVQCPNYDLCQKCESAHKHQEHLMVRMPTNNGPNVIDAWLSGPGNGSHHHRRSSRRFRAQCPFAEVAVAAAAADGPAPTAPAGAAAAGETHKESRRERRHSRRHGGVLSQFVEMMMNLPESNVPPTPAAPAAASSTEAKEEKQPPTAPPMTVQPEPKKAEPIPAKTQDIPIKEPVLEEPVTAAKAEEVPQAAPRVKEQAKPQAASSTASTPTTPIINLENLAQMVNPEYMRAGIEILNNFSEMFAKMIDPSEAAAFGCADTSMASNISTAASQKTETAPETQSQTSTSTSATASPAESLKPDSQPASADVAVPIASATVTTASDVAVPVAPATGATAEAPAVAAPEPEERRSSESLDQDWQMIDNTASPIANVSSSDALINLNATATTGTNTIITANSSALPASDFVQLGEMLRQHVTEEQQREQSTAHTQTSQVDTVSTSTSTTSVATNSTSTSTTPNPPAPEEKRTVPIYHTDERINAAVHAMMAMGFSNEGAWLTQLLESVEGNIPAALDIMHTSQSGRN